MALLAHELATNAAKYGALSNAFGKLSIAWSLSNEQLKFEWRESNGPIVTPPTHRGFGVRLLSRAMDQFGGTVETTFEPTGLVCKLKVTLAERTPSIVPEITNKGRNMARRARYWHLADITFGAQNVRSWGRADTG